MAIAAGPLPLDLEYFLFHRHKHMRVHTHTHITWFNDMNKLIQLQSMLEKNLVSKENQRSKEGATLCSLGDGADRAAGLLRVLLQPAGKAPHGQLHADSLEVNSKSKEAKGVPSAARPSASSPHTAVTAPAAVPAGTEGAAAAAVVTRRQPCPPSSH